MFSSTKLLVCGFMSSCWWISDIITSAQRYIHPKILQTYLHVVFQQFLAAVGPLNCMSDTHSIEKKLVYPTYTVVKVRSRLFLDRALRPTKVVHPAYKMCAFDLQKLCIRPTNVVHPTYKNCAFDLKKLCIRPTKSCASDL